MRTIVDICESCFSIRLTSSTVQYVSRPSSTRSTFGADSVVESAVKEVLNRHSASPTPDVDVIEPERTSSIHG